MGTHREIVETRRAMFVVQVTPPLKKGHSSTLMDVKLAGLYFYKKNCYKIKAMTASNVPPPPPDPPVVELKRHNTAPELRKKMDQLNMASTGSKSDLSLRLVKHYSYLTVSDVHREFTVDQLRKRVHDPDKSMRKKELCEQFINVTSEKFA